MHRWGYTARVGIEALNPIRHAWNGAPATRRDAPVHALCGAALRGLGGRSEHFDPNHERACKRCAGLLQGSA